MAELSAVYANALFELWLESGASGEYLKQAEYLRETLADAECQRVILSPRFSAAEKREFFNRAFAGSINDDLIGFISLAASKNRGDFIVPALAAFAEMAHRRGGRITAKVMSAAELDERQISALKTALEQKLKKAVDIEPEVDPSVIGGIYVYADGYFLDLTVKKHLRDLASDMKTGNVLL